MYITFEDFYNLDLFYMFSFCGHFLFLFIFCNVLLLIYSFLDLNNQIKNIKLYTGYECGFLAFSSARIKFDINFASVAILFIIFDIETVLLLPYILNFFEFRSEGFIILFFFFVFFVVGLYFELKTNILSI